MASRFAPKFAARQEGGNLIVKDSYRFRKYMATMGNIPLEIVVTKQRDQRSGNQNRYYRSVIVGMIAEETEHDEEEIHEILKRKFLTEKIEIAPNVFEERTGSTTELNTIQFEAYAQKCREWAQKFLGIKIPMPDRVSDTN